MPARRKTVIEPEHGAKTIAAIVNKYMGEGTLKVASDPSLRVSYLPTGVLPIDDLLAGGIPRGRMTEIFGNYSTLKSYIGLRAIATAQEHGHLCALVDTEHAFDPEWAEQLGVRLDNLLIEHPDSGEQAVDTTDMLIRSKVDLVVWDSVAATLPKAEAEKMAGDKHQPARLAALMSRAAQKLTAANKNHTALLFINQTREKVGIVWGSKETTPGGKALGFYSSYRVVVRKADKIKVETKVWNGEKIVGSKQIVAQRISASLEKSKLNSPHREVYFTWDYKAGDIDEIGYLIGVGVEKGHILREGTTKWRIKGSNKSHHGLPAFRGWIESNPQVIERLRSLSGSSHLPVKKKVGRRKKRS